MAWWVWVTLGWAVAAVGVAVVLGLAVREADRREGMGASLAVPPPPAPRPSAAAARRRVPVPPAALLLAGAGVTLEVSGFALRVADADRSGSLRLLSMDAPLSAPRMFIAGLFAAAAFAAAAGGMRLPGRGAWWAAVAVTAAVAAEVEGGGTVHEWLLGALGVADRPALALAASAGVVVAVLCVLRLVSGTERRDRRRVLAAFAVYGAAGGGLSAVSTAVAQHSGEASYWFAVATLVEESAEVLGAVSVLTAVLVGVAPRLVLPRDWVLRREADALTIDAADTGWAVGFPG